MGRPLLKIPPGQKFGKRTVIKFAGQAEKTRLALYEVICDCGQIDIVQGNKLKRGRGLSCKSCSNTTHGKTQDPVYNWFHRTKHRCENPNDPAYKNYGGRGIEFKFESFKEVLNEIGPKPGPEYSIDRWPNNTNGHYEPGNIRWATREQQQRNKRTNKLKDEDIQEIREMLEAGLTQTEIAEHFGVSQAMISCIKLDKNWRKI